MPSFSDSSGCLLVRGGKLARDEWEPGDRQANARYPVEGGVSQTVGVRVAATTHRNRRTVLRIAGDRTLQGECLRTTVERTLRSPIPTCSGRQRAPFPAAAAASGSRSREEANPDARPLR